MLLTTIAQKKLCSNPLSGIITAISLLLIILMTSQCGKDSEYQVIFRDMDIICEKTLVKIKDFCVKDQDSSNSEEQCFVKDQNIEKESMSNVPLRPEFTILFTKPLNSNSVGQSFVLKEDSDEENTNNSEEFQMYNLNEDHTYYSIKTTDSLDGNQKYILNIKDILEPHDSTYTMNLIWDAITQGDTCEDILKNTERNVDKTFSFTTREEGEFRILGNHCIPNLCQYGDDLDETTYSKHLICNYTLEVDNTVKIPLDTSTDYTNVSVDIHDITLAFSLPLNPESLDEGIYIIERDYENSTTEQLLHSQIEGEAYLSTAREGLLKPDEGADEEITYMTYNYDLDAPLRYATNYLIIVTENLQTTSGTRLSSALSLPFSTEQEYTE